MAYKFTEAADRDLVSILAATEYKFGDIQLERYKRLIGLALDKIDERPDRPGSKPISAIGRGVRMYHVGLAASSRDQGRHFLVYRTTKDGTVLVLRVLHDAMNLKELLALVVVEDD